MNLAWFGIVFSLIAIAYAFATSDAAVMVCGFLAFAMALGCLDDADDREYAEHADALNVHRVGSHHERDRA